MARRSSKRSRSLRTLALAAACFAVPAVPAWAIEYQVTNTNDSGSGSLRTAIANANSHAGYDRVEFAIGGAGVRTIAPRSPLPRITDRLSINGYSQPGSRENTRKVGSDAVILIELDGSLAGSGADGLVLSAPQSNIHGLAINRFSGDGVEITASLGEITGSHIGTDPTGEEARGNGGSGVRVVNAANSHLGGGQDTGHRNVISGNGIGVTIAGAGSVDGGLVNQYIGLDKDGQEDVGNLGSGISIEDAPSVSVGTDVSDLAHNFISGNDGDGIRLSGAGTRDTRIASSSIGTDVTETRDVGNGMNGVRVVNSSDNTIGDTEQAQTLPDGRVLFGAGNVVSGNDGSGVLIQGKGSRRNRVMNSQIGTDPEISIPLGNRQHGVAVVSGAQDNFVGGLRNENDERNEIAYNGLSGVVVTSGAVRTTIASNSIFANGKLGIDLNYDGVTDNDAGDGDSGPNGLQNFPVVTSASRSGSTTAIRGSLNSTPNTNWTVQLFASPTVDRSGYGGGKRLLGKAPVTTDGRGRGNFALSTPGGSTGDFVTAVLVAPGQLQKSSGSSSEFSKAVAVR